MLLIKQALIDLFLPVPFAKLLDGCRTSAACGWGVGEGGQLEPKAGTWANSVTIGAHYCIISAKQDIVQEKNGVSLPLAKFHNSQDY